MGQTFDFMGEVEDGWCWGRISGRMGVFPSNFVEMISEEVIKVGNKKERCQVLFFYQPVHNDELDLQVDQTIDFMCEVEDTWWMGRVSNRMGMFPFNLVEMVYEAPEEVTKTGDKPAATTVEAKDKKNSPTQLTKDFSAKVPEAADVLPAAPPGGTSQGSASPSPGPPSAKEDLLRLSASSTPDPPTVGEDLSRLTASVSPGSKDKEDLRLSQDEEDLRLSQDEEDLRLSQDEEALRLFQDKKDLRWPSDPPSPGPPTAEWDLIRLSASPSPGPPTAEGTF